MVSFVAGCSHLVANEENYSFMMRKPEHGPRAPNQSFKILIPNSSSLLSEHFCSLRISLRHCRLFYLSTTLSEVSSCRLRIAFKWMVRAFSGYLSTDQLLLLWDRILGYDSLEIVAGMSGHTQLALQERPWNLNNYFFKSFLFSLSQNSPVFFSFITPHTLLSVSLATIIHLLLMNPAFQF